MNRKKYELWLYGTLDHWETLSAPGCVLGWQVQDASMFSELSVGRRIGNTLSPSFLDSRALQDEFRPDGSSWGQRELGGDNAQGEEQP